MIVEDSVARRIIADGGHHCFGLIDIEDHYLRSYPHILKATNDLLKIKDKDFDPILAIAHMVYGWMPTILKSVNLTPSDKDVLAGAREVGAFDEAIALIDKFNKSPINNSWIGLSKVLHFINPEYFPIWDSKVASNFGLRNYHQMANKQNYLDYIRFVESHIHTKTVNAIQQEFSRVRYEVSNVRACEFCLFTFNPDDEDRGVRTP